LIKLKYKIENMVINNNFWVNFNNYVVKYAKLDERQLMK